MADLLASPTLLLLHRSLLGLRGLWINRRHSSDTTQDGSSSSREEDGTKQEDKIKNEILRASLPFVHKHGWTKNAISEGAQAVGYPGTAHGLFPQGGADLIQYFYVTCNQELAEALKNETKAAAADPSKCKQPAVFIHDAVQKRLCMIIPYISKWPQALAIMTLPPNVPAALANVLTLVDDICYYAGDRSVDFSWYSRRVALAGIYKMTELYMIQDKSANFEETWHFLGRRIEDASQLHNYLHQSGEVSQVAKEGVTAAFITARNILGLNLGNR